MEPDDPDKVTEDAIRKYIARAITGPCGDTFWDPDRKDSIIIKDDKLYEPNEWISPEAFPIRGEWYLDGLIDIMIYDEQEV